MLDQIKPYQPFLRFCVFQSVTVYERIFKVMKIHKHLTINYWLSQNNLAANCTDLRLSKWIALV